MTQQENGLQVLADIIRKHYDLGEVELPYYVPMAHQHRHRKLAVETSGGKFLCKTYKKDPVELDALRFQHRLSDHLDANGVPVARIKRGRNGRSIVEFDTWALELQEFVDASPMEVSAETLAISAAALGRFHHVCHEFPRPTRDTRMWRFSEVPRAAFGKLYEAAKTQGDEGEANRCCNKIALFLHQAAKELNWEARNKFETGLIHGDWHGGNLLFKDNDLAAVVDLEFSGDGCFLEDMSYAISNLCIRSTNKPDRLVKRVNILLDNYQTFRAMSHFELVALPYAVGVKHVTTVSYQIVQFGGSLAGLNAIEWMIRLAEQCDWLADHARHSRFGR